MNEMIGFCTNTPQNQVSEITLFRKFEDLELKGSGNQNFVFSADLQIFKVL